MNNQDKPVRFKWDHHKKAWIPFLHSLYCSICKERWYIDSEEIKEPRDLRCPNWCHNISYCTTTINPMQPPNIDDFIYIPDIDGWIKK